MPVCMFFPVKKILCPTDLSEPSYAAVSAAAAMAENQSAELVILHVITPVYHGASSLVPSGFDAKEYYRKTRDLAKKNLDDYVKKQIPKNLDVQILIKEGNAPDEIARTAEEDDIDLIVIATHGWTGWRRFMFGSVAEKVVRLSVRPVLTIPEPLKRD